MPKPTPTAPPPAPMATETRSQHMLAVLAQQEPECRQALDAWAALVTADPQVALSSGNLRKPQTARARLRVVDQVRTILNRGDGPWAATAWLQQQLVSHARLGPARSSCPITNAEVQLEVTEAAMLLERFALVMIADSQWFLPEPPKTLVIGGGRS